jgi:hypothetical protein
MMSTSLRTMEAQISGPSAAGVKTDLARQLSLRRVLFRFLIILHCSKSAGRRNPCIGDPLAARTADEA